MGPVDTAEAGDAVTCTTWSPLCYLYYSDMRALSAGCYLLHTLTVLQSSHQTVTGHVRVTRLSLGTRRDEAQFVCKHLECAVSRATISFNVKQYSTTNPVHAAYREGCQVALLKLAKVLGVASRQDNNTMGLSSTSNTGSIYQHGHVVACSSKYHLIAILSSRKPLMLSACGK